MQIDASSKKCVCVNISNETDGQNKLFCWIWRGWWQREVPTKPSCNFPQRYKWCRLSSAKENVCHVEGWVKLSNYEKINTMYMPFYKDF